jgi:HPt (histidine-containing phosphotransfer) domain-containing protein
MRDAAAQVAARLAEIWRKSRPVVMERLEVLRTAHQRLSEDTQDAAARELGREAAHRLAGILGVFGLAQGGEIASEMEGLLKSPDPLTTNELTQLGTQLAALEAEVASKPAS